MPVYEFACRPCERVFQSLRRAGDTVAPNCPLCGELTHRKWSAPAVHIYQPHTSASTGGVEITSARQHADTLKALSDAETTRTGIPANYIPVHPADAKEVYGITEEGLDTTYRREVAEGKKDVKLWL